MYGLPFFTAKINPDLYEKKEILSQIEKNYKVSRVRNNWSPSAYSKTDIHQSIEDEENPRFKRSFFYKKILTLLIALLIIHVSGTIQL